MNMNAVGNCTHIIRSQIEYSASTQTVTMRCILETLATGERRGFSDMDELMIALRTELIDIQTQIVSRSNSKDKET